jgi:hypothetical protein
MMLEARQTCAQRARPDTTRSAGYADGSPGLFARAQRAPAGAGSF